LDHYIYELILKTYTSENGKSVGNVNGTNEEFFKIHRDAIDNFCERDNTEWINKYWKYVEKTEIYGEIFSKIARKNIYNVYLKYKREIDIILCRAYVLEDISEDKEFIFNKANKTKYNRVYKSGYTKSILSEVDLF